MQRKVNKQTNIDGRLKRVVLSGSGLTKKNVFSHASNFMAHVIYEPPRRQIAGDK